MLQMVALSVALMVALATPASAQSDNRHKIRGFQNDSVGSFQRGANSGYDRTERWYEGLSHKPVLLLLIGGIISLLWTWRKNKNHPKWAILAGLSWIAIIAGITLLLRSRG